ncbi:hypothetical protein DIS18_11560 [Algibacter marinivivus]|uniref:DoxX protein n=1 Tax=Algibacter marinivivus TaxID=2100723 RepID=A0A2U2X4Z6_9FLAO|nr:hypothetical protein [Algibacter marinivivus]PWH82858.1 hypothetical protein DIS18_11560 [Algibacter marinivivus]
MKNINLKHSIELAARIYVWFILSSYGLGKIVGGQFHRRGKLTEDVAVQTLDNATAFDLAWTFMGYSQAYITFIGMSQIIGAFLLLFNKTKFLGIIILVPILLNIIIFDIIFLPDYGALASATIYFSLLILVLYLNKERLINAYKSFITVNPNEAKLYNIKIIIITVTIIAIIFGLDQASIYFLDKSGLF